jgi:hypothetical protein
MYKTLTLEKNPRIASYAIPMETWVLSALLIGLAIADRFLDNDQMHVVVDVVIIPTFVVNALEFVIPFIRPNSILGGAQLKAAVLAGAALLAWLV